MKPIPAALLFGGGNGGSGGDKPVIFKGTLGTEPGAIQQLPQASEDNHGHMYIVVTEGTYASQPAQVGDQFISNGSIWKRIPSGDDNITAEDVEYLTEYEDVNNVGSMLDFIKDGMYPGLIEYKYSISVSSGIIELNKYDKDGVLISTIEINGNDYQNEANAYVFSDIKVYYSDSKVKILASNDGVSLNGVSFNEDDNVFIISDNTNSGGTNYRFLNSIAGEYIKNWLEQNGYGDLLYDRSGEKNNIIATAEYFNWGGIDYKVYFVMTIGGGKAYALNSSDIAANCYGTNGRALSGTLSITNGIVISTDWGGISDVGGNKSLYVGSSVYSNDQVILATSPIYNMADEILMSDIINLEDQEYYGLVEINNNVEDIKWMNNVEFVPGAKAVNYDGTSSGLSSENVQDAIDEVNEKIEDIEFSASDITYENATSGLDATDVQDAIDEVNTKVNTLPKPMQYKGTLGTGGTIQTLPAASNENNGYVYKVITDAVYALDSFYYKVVCRSIGLYRVWDCTKAKDSSYTDIIKQEILEPRGGQGPLTFDDTLKIGGPYNHTTITALVDGILYNGVTYNTGEAIFSSNTEFWTCSGISYGQQIHAKVGDIFVSNGTEWTYIPSGDEANSIAELSDTNISNLANGDTLVYDLATEKWKNKPLDIQAEDVSFTNPDPDSILLPDNTQGVFDALLEGYTNEPKSHSYKYEFTWPSGGSVTCKYSENGTLLETKEVGYWDSYLFRGIQVSRNGVGNPMFTKTASCRNGLVVTINGAQQGVFDNITPVASSGNYATTVVMELAWTDPVEFHPGASYVNYDNTDSGLEATDVQGAIDEVNDNLTNYQTDNGWYVKKYSNGYFEAYKHDEVDSSGTSSSTLFNAYSHAKVVSFPSFITNPTSQIKVLNSNIRVGNGFAIQVYQSVASDGIHISALSNLESGYYASDHYMFGTL